MAGVAWAQALNQNPTLKLNAAEEAITLMDFEEAARRVLPPAHWGYMASGVDDDGTLRANREGFNHFQLRPRRLVDVSHIDLKTEIFGAVWDSPIFLCPIGGQKMFHPEGEVAVARDGVTIATLGRGDGVGEMGLLRAVPRTATVTARTEVLAYALDREPFLIAVTGHAATTDAVGDVVERRFAELADLGVSAD